MATERTEEHEVNDYVSIARRLKDRCGEDRIPVKLKSPLGSILTEISNSPAMAFAVSRIRNWVTIADIPLIIAGEDAGSFGQPNIEKILEKSKPSPFGKGDKTVMDLEYRNGCGV